MFIAERLPQPDPKSAVPLFGSGLWPCYAIDIEWLAPPEIDRHPAIHLDLLTLVSIKIDDNRFTAHR